ncbi:hypothetical protein DXG03_001555, partial [Asterophora parasitica]
MERLIEEYSRSAASPSAPPRRQHQPVTPSILLTGSTGNLGSDLLALLLQDPSVTRIYALNRRSSQGSASERVHAQFAAKGLDVAALKSEKLVFIEGDTTLPDLGLGHSLYAEISASISMIIHNAWTINLQQDLPFFVPNIVGLRNLINLGHVSSSASTLRFVFVSSLFAAQSWNAMYDSRAVPEEILLDTVVGCGTGYGASKHVAERIVARSGLNGTTLRIGQLCGRHANGHWSASEWVPLAVNASITLGTLPSFAGVSEFLYGDVSTVANGSNSKFLPFIPLDVTAKSIHEVLSSAHPLPDVLNFSHPRPFRWTLLNDAVFEVISAQKGYYPLRSISISEWVVQAEHSEQLRQRRHPVIKLLPLLRNLALQHDDVLRKGTQDTEHLPRPRLSTSKAQDHSPTLRGLEQVLPVDAKRWLEYWISFKHFQTALRQANIA